MNGERQEPQPEEQVFEPPPPPAFVRPAIITTEPPPDGWPEGYPKVYFSIFERLPPIVVLNKEDEDATINKTYWTTIPPEEPEPEPPV